jgi:hypothetical protein
VLSSLASLIIALIFIDLLISFYLHVLSSFASLHPSLPASLSQMGCVKNNIVVFKNDIVILIVVYLYFFNFFNFFNFIIFFLFF